MPSSRARRAAARNAAAQRRRRGSVGVGLVAVVAMSAVVGTSTGFFGSSSGSSSSRPTPGEVRDGSEKLASRGRLRIGVEPSAYRVVYRVETFSGGDRIVTRDEVDIRRPFEGHTRKLAGAKAGAEVRSEQVGAMGRIFVPKTSQSSAVLLETGPAVAPSDLRIAPVLDDLLSSRRAEAREWRSVLKRPCQVLRFGGPISAGSVPAVLEPDAEYADACVSEQGLVLEEVWVVEGSVQRRRLAISIEVGDSVVEEASFAIPTEGSIALPVDQGGGSFRAIDPLSAYPAPFWVLDDPPLPEYLGRWAAVSPAGGDPKDDEIKERRLGFVVDLWQSGIDVVAVEQGSTAGGVQPFELGDGPRVTVDGLGEGELVLDLRTSELRFLRPDGYFLRVRATAGRARLEAIARQLRETPGGSGLTYLDGRS